MSKCSYRLGLPVAAVLAVVGLSFQPQDPEAPGTGPDLTGTVGVVDALEVLNAYPRAIQGMARLEQINNEFRQTVEQHEDRILQLELDMRSLVEGTQVRDLKSVEHQVARVQLQGLVQVHERRMLGERQPFLVEMYRDIWEAVDNVAQIKGLQLVLRLRQDVEGASLDAQRITTDMRTVLYAASVLDVTQDVIDTLKAND